MLKHYIDIFTNTYIIEEDGVILFSIELIGSNRVHIRGANNIFEGDIKEAVLLDNQVLKELL